MIIWHLIFSFTAQDIGSKICIGFTCSLQHFKIILNFLVILHIVILLIGWAHRICKESWTNSLQITFEILYQVWEINCRSSSYSWKKMWSNSSTSGLTIPRLKQKQCCSKCSVLFNCFSLLAWYNKQACALSLLLNDSIMCILWFWIV